LSPTSKLISSTINSPLTSASTLTQTPTLYAYQNETNNSKNHNFKYQPQQNQNQQTVPSTPPGTTQRISLKVGPNGITSINTFNLVANEQQNTQPVLAKKIKQPKYIGNPTPIQIKSTNINDSSNIHNGSPVLYRTELTIMPFNLNQS
jgi:hypothetical protein